MLETRIKTTIIKTPQKLLHNLQPQAALFKNSVEVGTSEFLKWLSLQWGDSISSAQWQELKFFAENMG